MAISALFSFWVRLFFSYSLCLSFFMAAAADDGRKTPPPIALPRPLLSPPPSSQNRATLTPFRPSIAVIVGVLTTMFSVTFLLLMYAKHCKRSHATGNYIGGNGNPHHHHHPSSTSGAAARRNSGIDRSVIESLPIFRFSSLRGQKEGLECAVCLTRFEPTEVLRLLPKCKHAFHVECVDTWLDAHSTCPLCRYRVDPEDVLLIEDTTKLVMNINNNNNNEKDDLSSRRCSESTELDRTGRNSTELVVMETGSGSGFSRRVSGRHSSAGERTSHFLQILVQRPSESLSSSAASFWASRRSLDSASSRKKRETAAPAATTTTTGVNVGCFERSSGRKDGLLLSSSDSEAAADEKEKDERFMRRFEHRIILSRDNSSSSSVGVGGYHRRWSDLRPSDLLFLQSELIISNSGRYSLSASQPSAKRGQEQQREQGNRGGGEDKIDGSGRSVINSRCMSEITGLSRFSNRTDGAVGT